MVYFIQLILNIVFSFRKKDVKVVSLFGILTLAYYTGTMNPFASYDTLNYATYYSSLRNGMIPTSIFESGYKMLNDIGVQYGLSYSDFRMATSVLFFLILYWTLIRLKVNTNVFLALYSIFPFFSEATQVRNFFMTTLVLLAVTFITKKTKQGYIIGMLVIILASQFHNFGYFYLLIFPLLLVKNETVNKIIKWLPSLSLLLTILLIAAKNYTSILISFILGGTKGQAYAAIWLNYGVVISIILINVFSTMMVLIINRYYKNNVIDVLNRIFLLLSITTPIICISTSGFSRILRTQIIIVILLISMVFFYRKENDKKEVTLIKNKITFPILIVMVLALLSLDGGTLNLSHQEFGASMGSYVPYILHFKEVTGYYDNF